MTVEFLKKYYKIETESIDELYDLAEQAKTDGLIELSQYATLKANINRMNPNIIQEPAAPRGRTNYTDDEVLAVTQSFLDVYDGKKNEQAHLHFIKSMFGESSTLYKNGIQHCRNFQRTLDLGSANLGQSMAANWAEAIFILIKDRKTQRANVLKACRTIYESTNNGNMYDVIKKWIL